MLCTTSVFSHTTHPQKEHLLYKTPWKTVSYGWFGEVEVCVAESGLYKTGTEFAKALTLLRYTHCCCSTCICTLLRYTHCCCSTCICTPLRYTHCCCSTCICTLLRYTHCCCSTCICTLLRYTHCCCSTCICTVHY